MAHLIYSKLTSANVLNAAIGEGKDRKHISVEFLPDDKKSPESGRTELTDAEFEALMSDGGPNEDSMLKILLRQGDFVEAAKESKNDVESLKGELKSLQLKLKLAEEEAEKIAKEEKKKDKKESK